MRSEHVSTIVHATAEQVYTVASDVNRLSEWAHGLAEHPARRDGEALVVDAPTGQVRVTFAPSNPFWVLDHDVELPDGRVVNNPMRVLKHPDGAEVVFTVRQLEMSDQDFARDVVAVKNDLERLRKLVERDN